MNGFFVGEALSKAVDTANLAIVEAVLRHPKASQIPPLVVNMAISKAKGDNKEAIIEAIKESSHLQVIATKQ